MKRLIVFCLVLALLPAIASADSGYADYVMTRTLREQFESKSNTRLIDVPGRGEMIYYAQANPFWTRFRYETMGSKTFRRFGAGGCCPTSTAIALANLLTPAELASIRPYASKRAGGFGITTASMNPLNASINDGVYWFDHEQDYLDFLPLVVGQFAAGNNEKSYSWRVGSSSDGGSVGGTSAGFIQELARCYGITLTKVADKDDTSYLDMIRCGATAIALANTRWQPFSTGVGHFVAVVAADDEYLYIMDPQNKTKYDDCDRFDTLEVLESGLVRARIENYHNCQFSNVYVLTTPELDARIALNGAVRAD